MEGDCVLLSVGPGQHDPAVHQVSWTLEGRDYPGRGGKEEDIQETSHNNFTEPRHPAGGLLTAMSPRLRLGNNLTKAHNLSCSPPLSHGTSLGEVEAEGSL